MSERKNSQTQPESSKYKSRKAVYLSFYFQKRLLVTALLPVLLMNGNFALESFIKENKQREVFIIPKPSNTLQQIEIHGMSLQTALIVLSKDIPALGGAS